MPQMWLKIKSPNLSSAVLLVVTVENSGAVPGVGNSGQDGCAGRGARHLRTAPGELP